jgi:hypothetical protein
MNDANRTGAGTLLTAKLTIALAIAGAVSPAGVHAVPQDLRSPDAREAPQPSAAPRQDLRSPDARDAARGDLVPPVKRAAVTPTRVAPAARDPFEWEDAGIGAAVAFGLVGAAGGALLLVGRRRAPAP